MTITVRNERNCQKMPTLHEIFHRFPKEFPLPMLLDGSTGTSLMRCGMPNGACPESWVLEHPDIIKKIQRGYVDAGSDALYTPTFGANSPTLRRNHLDGADRINRELAELTVGRARLTGGDMSPTGLFIEPFGDATFDEVAGIYAEQASALDAAGVDFFIVETNISLQEVRAAVTGIKQVSSKPVFVTMTVDDHGRTLSGDRLDCCLVALAELGISAFGTNCSQGPDKMLELLRGLTQLSVSLGIPLVAKPNAGMPHEDPDGSRHFDLDAESFAGFAPEFLASGIYILGGCCGTDDEYIARLRTAIDRFEPTGDLPAPLDTAALACTNRTLVTVDTGALGEPLLADDDLADAEPDDDWLYVSIPDADAADCFIEYAPTLPYPCAVTGDKTEIERVKRLYNGRLVVITG